MSTYCKKDDISAESVESNIVEIEERSFELLEMLNETSEKLNGFYKSSAEDALDPAFSEKNAASLKKATKTIQKSYWLSYRLSDELNARRRDSKKRNLFPSNMTIDRLESKAQHFASGFGLYKLLWVGYIGSFFGVLIELLWCFLCTAGLESRSGLVWGPFNLLYGAGAMVLTASLYRFRHRGYGVSFFGGFLVGSVVEYLCSYFQELAFGCRSWDYSEMPFNINGRICLLYSLIWGVLGVLWIKNIYPFLSKIILKIPNKVGKVITWAIFAFFVLNSLMTVLSVVRWTQRLDGIEASNAFWSWFDMRFPNERMEKIFANMSFNK